METMTRKKRKPVAEINVVPYIDVMLVLLIVFMVTAPMLEQGIDVDLHVWEGLWHVFEWDDSLPESNESIKNIAAFLLRYIKQ